MTLYEKISLPNGMTLDLWDYSREVAAKTVKVELVAKMAVPFEASFFNEKEEYDKLVKTIGSVGLYEYRKIRPLLNAAAKDSAFEDLVTEFKTNVLPYVSKANFPQQFARSKYRDITINWFKYTNPHEEN
ncbi:MAG: hypothetical protein CSYNP_00652 [Syntrophus sp. SKADARSKE-3]|nr:hypothetical protein [Syntrophus sp. SKADARSKE-3]